MRVGQSFGVIVLKFERGCDKASVWLGRSLGMVGRIFGVAVPKFGCGLDGVWAWLA